MLAALLSTWAPAHAGCAPDRSPEEWIEGNGLCLAVAIAAPEPAAERRALVVAVHGDVSRGGPAHYLHPFIDRIAAADVMAVAVIRPGYSDAAGRTSEGTNFGRSDSYTADNIDAVAGVVAALRTRFAPTRTVLVGHSGGAAIAGVLLARHPGLADAAVLVSCPCDIPRWRAARGRDPWHRSLSPHDHAAALPQAARVIAITGSRDDNTGPELARDYVAVLGQLGVHAEFREVAEADHGFNALAQEATRAVDALLAR